MRKAPAVWSRSLCAALLSAGLAACLPAFDPDLDASRLGDAELQLCGTQGGACCAAPASACDDELVCDNNRQLCMRQPVLLCDSDAECGGGEVCCPSGFVGTCTRGAKEDCPALDLIVATPQLDFDAVDLRYFDPDVESDRCLIERGCVGGEGWRRLLGVSTVVSNVDGADLLLGSPTDSAESTTTCRGEARFASFLRYELVDSNGTKAQQDIAAACAPASTGQFIAPFDCDFQGIWSGYSQAYVSSLSEGGSADGWTSRACCGATIRFASPWIRKGTFPRRISTTTHPRSCHSHFLRSIRRRPAPSRQIRSRAGVPSASAVGFATVSRLTSDPRPVLRVSDFS